MEGLCPAALRTIRIRDWIEAQWVFGGDAEQVCIITDQFVPLSGQNRGSLFEMFSEPLRCFMNSRFKADGGGVIDTDFRNDP